MSRTYTISILAGILVIVLLGVFFWQADGDRPSIPRITVACAAVGIEFDLCREGAEAWARESGHEVAFIQTPSLAEERLALFQQLLAAGSPDIDVFQIDVIWPGTLGRYFLDLTPFVEEEALAGHFPALLDTYRIGGELKALPWYADAGLLYYREDLLVKYDIAPPETWAELKSAAEKILAEEHAAGNTRITGYVFQGRAYEGLTCNALEWISSFGGPAILDDEGLPALATPQAEAALSTAARWIGGITPRGVLNYSEEDARGIFQTGNAVFMRSWPYAWALVQSADSPVRGKVGITRLPAGGPTGVHAAALGGGALAVSKFSAHPAAAASLVRYLTGPSEQLRRAKRGAIIPTIASVYEDAELLSLHPFMSKFPDILADAVARPAHKAGPDYNRVSTIFWNAVHDVLSGERDANDALSEAEEAMRDVLGVGS